MRARIEYTTLTLALAAFAPLAGCGGDDGGSDVANPETTGDGEPGDGDGDPGDGDGDPGDGDGDGDPGDGDGDGPCASTWEQTQMKVNGQVHAGFDVDVAANGEFVVAGRIDNANFDAWIGKFSPSGEQLWSQTVDSGGVDFASGVVLDDAGDLIVVGSLQGSNGKDLWIEKRSGADGSVDWTTTEVSNFAGDNEPGDVALAPDGTIVVSGTVRMGDQDSDIWVRKLASADGSPSWTATYSGNVDMSGFSIDRGASVSVAPNGSIYVGGELGVNFETREAVVLAYGPEGGAEQWQLSPHATGGAHLHRSVGVAAGPENEVYFAVYQSTGIWRFWVHRASAAGELGWELTEEDFVYSPTKDWGVAGLAVSDAGLLTIGGSLRNEEIGQGISWSEAWVANLSLTGEGQCIGAHTWKNTHIIPASTYNYGLAEGPSGTVVVGEVRDGPENYLWVGGFGGL
ncbi:BNR repeat domain protein [Enhygromyxa salina]|uniref:BNR repeat domain protein n=2 Tax=Enhygromyxa salina TaxID=215803 RepID=A0A0C2DC27_9BACT|nr:BNR repeat domain protein [Enhygromyxa salina]